MEQQTLFQALSAEIEQLGRLGTENPAAILWQNEKWLLRCTDSGAMLERFTPSSKQPNVIAASTVSGDLPAGAWLRYFPRTAAVKAYGERYLAAWARFTGLCRALEENRYPAALSTEPGAGIGYCECLRQHFKALSQLLQHIQYHRIGEADYFVRQLDAVDSVLNSIGTALQLLGDYLQFDSLRAYSGILPAGLCTGSEESAEMLAKKLKAFVSDHKTKEKTT